jgi:hypothetical protein
MEGRAVGHIIERGPTKDHPSQICFLIWFSGFRGEDLNVIFFIKISLICIIGINRLKEKFHRKNPSETAEPN